MIITRKIQLYSDDKAFWDFLFEMNKIVFRMCNLAMQQLYINDCFEDMLMPDDFAALEASLRNSKTLPEERKAASDKIKSYRKEVADKIYKTALETSKQNTVYRSIANEFPEVQSYVRSAVTNMVFANYKSDYMKVKRGEATQRTYKKDCPIPIMKTALRELTEEGFILFSSKVKFVFGKDKSFNQDIIRKIVSNELKLSDSSFLYKDKKAYILLCFNAEEQDHNLNKDITAFVDISYKCPILISTNISTNQIEIGDINKLINLRIQLSKRYQNIQPGLKFNTGGKGRNKKLSGLDQLSEKERNIAKTFNHQITKDTINQIFKLNAGKIVIRLDKSKLENVNDKFEKNFIHRYWGYADIILKLQYKSKLHGIECILEKNVEETKNKVL